MDYAMRFITQRPDSLVDVMALSLIATLGQIFIYITVQKHGPVTLSLIMTTRQIASVLISCVLFGHGLPSIAIGAAAVVFSVLMVRSYRSTLKGGEETKKGKALLEGETQKAASSDATSE